MLKENTEIFLKFFKMILFHFMMEPRTEIKKNRMDDQWQRLGYEIF